MPSQTALLDTNIITDQHSLTIKMADPPDPDNPWGSLTREQYLDLHLYNPVGGRLTGLQLMPANRLAVATMASPTLHGTDWTHGEAACEMFIAQLTTFVEGIPHDCPAPYIAPEFFTDKLEVAIENAATGIRHHPTSFPPAGMYIDCQ